MRRLIGDGNVADILVNGLETRGVVDTGSMVTTMNIELYNRLDPKPELRSLNNFDLKVSGATGEKVPYIGYVEVGIATTFTDSEVDIPVLVVPENSSNSEVPVIIGTNVIRIFKEISSGAEYIPDSWNMAFQHLIDDSVGTIKTTRKITLKPYEVKTITGFVRKTRSVESAVTEAGDDFQDQKRVSICPRVVTLK